VSRILVDTHIALWALSDPDRLTAGERALLIDPGIERVMSPISVWEVAIKREAGRLVAPKDIATVFAQQFRMLPVDAALLERAAQLPTHHGDPFDRVLIAHALLGDLAVLTRDQAFASYGVRRP
jgi:PIN domain nuclease of toxin-antitoxin system